jgi:TetR/AcrR family transcriptional regulator
MASPWLRPHSGSGLVDSRSRRDARRDKKVDAAGSRRARRRAGRPPKGSAGEVSVSDRILGVATELFAARGYAGVSIRQIADRSGYSLSSLYHHFGNKRSLYVKVHMTEFEKSSARLEAAIESGESFEQRLLSFTIELVRVLSQPGPLFKLLARHWLDSDPKVVRLLAQATVPEQYGRVQEAIRQSCERRNPTASAMAIYALVHGLVTLRPFEESLPWQTGVSRAPPAMAKFVLSSLLPEIDWHGVSAPGLSAKDPA